MNLLGDAADYLRRRVSDSLSRGGVNSYFTAWLLPDLIDPDMLKSNVVEVAERIAGAQRSYQDVAILGFAMECGMLEGAAIEKLREGLRWMAGRTTHVAGHPADFCTDAVSLLGISLGLRCLNDNIARPDWVATTCPISGQRDDDWRESLIAIAHRISGAATPMPLSDEVSLIAFAKGIVTTNPSLECCTRVVDRLKMTELPLLSDEEVTIRFAALRLIEAESPRIAINRATVADLVSVLRAIPAGLQRWTWEEKPKTSKSEARKWHVDHEYHVQNLAWFLVSPLFPDAQFEEHKSAVASVHPRLDIVIPSLRLIIEVKFWRRTAKSEEIVRELAEDVGLYLTPDAPYDGVVPLIWDDGARTEEHAALISGLKKMKGVLDAVIVSRPALMKA